MNAKTPTTIHQTNAHFQKWGNRKMDLVSYTSQNGSKLNGVLHYPINHDASKKYPMIVFIYEKLSQRKNQYEIPSYYNGAGFNVANYIYDGYFVLLPDIEYEIGNPGVSAKECVLNAVEQALKEKTIDESRLGIIGHSFGGYQVASIITQTNKFKAAVAGAAVTDPVNLYVQMNWSWNRTQAWRFESQQMRMGTNPFENPELYFANSPLYNAAKINTPVLIWTGKEDYNVDWNQSIYFHMALRRLNKKNKLLLFPAEGHTIHNPENQIQLTLYIKQWFNRYLLNETH
jgi:dipeptidyl aminopeptidase/acylaminoacyl peptidase